MWDFAYPLEKHHLSYKVYSYTDLDIGIEIEHSRPFAGNGDKSDDVKQLL